MRLLSLKRSFDFMGTFILVSERILILRYKKRQITHKGEHYYIQLILFPDILIVTVRKVRLIKFIQISRIREICIREENTYERKRFRGGSYFPHAQAVSFPFVNPDSRANYMRISRILRTASRRPPSMKMAAKVDAALLN